jgi:hypothetical protein
MSSAGFEPAIPASQRLQTHALDRAATGIGRQKYIQSTNLIITALHFINSDDMEKYEFCGLTKED